MKLPNGYGTVYKLPGNRRRPYIARKTKDIVNGKQTYITVGYFGTREEALNALAEYNLSPVMDTGITFAEVYKLWASEHLSKTVESGQRAYISAFNHSSYLHNMKFQDVRPCHMEYCIEHEDVGNATKQRMKSLYNLMYKYAMKNDLCRKDYAALVNSVKRESKPPIHEPFSAEEISLLWSRLRVKNVDMILVGIYSGWRPQELCSLKIEDIDLDSGFMTGGLKTEAGKNRRVPIHSSILPLISARIEEAKYIPSDYLFNELPTQSTPRMTYDRWRHKWNAAMKQLGLSHRPHDTRHTFITLAKESGMDEFAIKRMVGHYIDDVTEAVYTHHTDEYLHDQIEMIKKRD